MEQSNGLEAKISREEIRITVMMDLQEIFLHLIGISFQGLTSPMRIITPTTEYHIINAQTSHSIEIMEIDLQMNLSTIRSGTGEPTEISLAHQRLTEETSHKITLIAKQEVISLTTLSSADLTVYLRLVLRPMNKSFRGTIIRHHLMWFATPQPMTPLTKYRIFTR